MNWKDTIQTLLINPSRKLFCLHGELPRGNQELHELSEILRKNNSSQTGISSNKIILLPSRAQYIQRHKYEGLFFQQRYQSSWKDQGETVRGRLMSSSASTTSAKMEQWKEMFELVEIWDKPLLQLSSGEWQRFSLCEGLMAKPGILIVPDLLKGLDQRWQQKIINVLSENTENKGIVIFTSDIPAGHDSVVNIKTGPSSIAQYTIKTPEVSEALREAFHKYQSQFLNNSSRDILVQMNGVNIQYGNKEILKDFHWAVHAGDKWNIHGPNGAGKSTLISLVNADNPQGYSQPIQLFGEKYGRYSIWERKARIAYFGSDFFQYFRSSKSMEEVLRQHLHTPYLETVQPPDSLVKELLTYFDLDKYQDLQYATIPNDIRRQTLLLGSYLKSSDVLVLDEPYQDLNYERIQLNNRFLESVQPGSHQTVIFVTHREDHRPGFLDQVLKLREGRIVF